MATRSMIKFQKSVLVKINSSALTYSIHHAIYIYHPFKDVGGEIGVSS